MAVGITKTANSYARSAERLRYGRSQARAQQTKVPMIGILSPASEVASKRFFDGFPSGMQQMGYIEGRDYVMERRYADGDLARLPSLAEELVRLKADVIVAGTSSSCPCSKGGNDKHSDCRRQLV